MTSWCHGQSANLLIWRSRVRAAQVAHSSSSIFSKPTVPQQRKTTGGKHSEAQGTKEPRCHFGMMPGGSSGENVKPIQIMTKQCVWDDKKMTCGVLLTIAYAFRVYFLCCKMRHRQYLLETNIFSLVYISSWFTCQTS